MRILGKKAREDTYAARGGSLNLMTLNARELGLGGYLVYQLLKQSSERRPK
jgi:hypothetical protein